jgi:Tfp pilus assembly protein PilF
MLKSNLLFGFLFITQLLPGQKATVTVETRDILTYPYSDPNPVPVLVEGMDEIFPYHSFNGYSLKGEMQNWKVIKLENDYLEVYVLPADGGKVWGAIEKSTGKEFIYRNEVMKYRNISMRGPWTSGGIEFNFGFIGHNPSTCVPVDYKIVENADGSVSCFVGSLDLPSRTKWSVEVRLQKDKAYFETIAMWNNHTVLPQTYYNWMTAAAVVTDDLEFFYPGDQEVGHGGERSPWPVDNEGHDLSTYKGNAFGSDRSAHIVGEYNDFMGGYYHNSNFGFGHYALYDDMPGHKLFLWSQARSGGIWEDLLTDTDGQYFEFQAGRMFNQYGGTSAFETPISQTPFNPGLTDRWKELWFPVKEIGGLSDVSSSGVLYAKAEDGKLQVGVNALSFAKGKIIVKSGGKVLLTEERSFKPMEVYKTSVPLNSNAEYDVIVEGMDLHYNPSKKEYLKRPFISKMTKDIETGASLYQEGDQLKDAREYTRARNLFKRCLEKDPLYIDALAGLAELYYRSLEYDSALYYADMALQLDTYHPTANFNAGITYLAKGDLVNAIESLGWAARSPEYRSTAYAQMAGIELMLQNKELTEHYAHLALDYNRYNFNAMEVLAINYRKSGETELADKYIDEITELDQLNHFADYERSLLHPSDENHTRFTSTITNEMPYQTYLELSMVYYNLGLKSDALQLLEKAPSHALITLWKAYLKDDISLVNEVAMASPAFVFPYRAETVSPLKWAMSKNSSWKFKYYLAMNYDAVQREADAMKLYTDCGQEPDYAPFYLTRAALLRSRNDEQELTDLQRAQKLAPDDWRTLVKLIDYYENHHDYKMALNLATIAQKSNKDNPALGIKYAIAQINTGQYAKSLKTLESMNILPSEGASQGKVVFEQACLFLAMDMIKQKKYSEATKMIEKSKEWPENLGVGKPFEVDTRIQDYLSIYCLDKLNKSGATAELRKSVVDYTNNHLSPSFNNLLAIKLLNDQGETVGVNTLIDKIDNSSASVGDGDNGRGGNQINQWVIAVYKNNQANVDDLEKNFGGNTNFTILKKLLEVTAK